MPKSNHVNNETSELEWCSVWTTAVRDLIKLRLAGTGPRLMDPFSPSFDAALTWYYSPASENQP